MSNLIIKTFKYLSNLISRTWRARPAICRIIEINTNNNQVTIYSHATNVVITLSFSDAIDDIGIMSNLSPVHACWLGYYFGRLYRKALNEDVKSIKMPQMQLKPFGNRFKFIAHDIATGIVYEDIRTKQIYRQNPLLLAQNEHLISSFNQNQSCYIGILAGINSVKQENIPKFNKNPGRPKLFVVK